MQDINYLTLLFNKRVGYSSFNPNADLNDDLVINMRDLAIAIFNFKHE